MKKHIIVITTGGTIAMKPDPKTGGLVPAVSGEDLAAAVPGLSDWADVEVVEFSNVPSGWMDVNRMWKLSQLIDQLAAENKADGFVVTHGTDTLEETAFFLDLTLKTDKPVCVTGAMRGAADLSADGPENILSAVRVAADDMSKCMGVLVCLQDRIYAAWDVTKFHTTNPDTFRDLHYGPLGTVYSHRIIYGRRPIGHIRLHPDHIEPDVWMVTCWSGMDGKLIEMAGKAPIKALVVDALGCGNVPPLCRKEMMKLGEAGLPLVLTTRVPTGHVMEEYSYEGSALSMKESGLILGDRLSAWKARLLLVVALGVTSDREELRKIFAEV